MSRTVVGISPSLPDPSATEVAANEASWQGPNGPVTAIMQAINVHDPVTATGLNITTLGAAQVDGSATTQPVSNASLSALEFDPASNLRTFTQGYGKTGYAAVPTGGALTVPVILGTLPAGTRKVEFTLKNNDSVQFVIAQTNPGDVSGTPGVVSPLFSGNTAGPGSAITIEIHVDAGSGWNLYMGPVAGTPQWRAL